MRGAETKLTLFCPNIQKHKGAVSILFLAYTLASKVQASIHLFGFILVPAILASSVIMSAPASEAFTKAQAESRQLAETPSNEQLLKLYGMMVP